MKPINSNELKRSYLVFSVNFGILIIFSIGCLYFFFATEQYEYHLIKDRVTQTEQLLAKRKEMNLQFDLILSGFNNLSRFSAVGSEEMDNQVIMLENIQDANFKIRDILKQAPADGASFMLYKKMTDDVTQMAGIQDSLFTTRFQLESIKSQLGNCLKINHSASSKLSLGIFRR